VTLSQLKVFVLVARLGSVKAAAAALGVSEPAVSQALTALRQSLGDQLMVRAGTTMELTAAGRRVVGIASQMVNLAADAESAVRQSQGAPELLRVVATNTIATTVAPALLQAFTARGGRVEVTLGTASTAEMQALLLERLADVVLGPLLVTPGIDSTPFMRYRLVFVAATGHRLAGAGTVPVERLAGEPWCVDPTGPDPGSDIGQVITRLRVPPERIRVFPTAHEAWAAAAAGNGIAPAVEQLVERERERLGLNLLPVTSQERMWHVNTLSPDRRSVAASRLRRFLATPDALHVMHRADAGVPAARFKPPVYVTIWS